MKSTRFDLKPITVFLLLFLVMVMPTAPAFAAGSAQAETFHLHVPAVAEIYSSTCAWDWVPAVDTMCEDWYVQYFIEGQPSTLREQPWSLTVYHWVVILHPDSTGNDLSFASGNLENPQGSFDMQKYTSAQVSGMVPMSDGSEVAVDLTWDMRLAALHHAGNNGPYNVNNGIARHYVDRCVTVNAHAHQQWRAGTPGQISGSIGSLDVQSLFLPSTQPFIAGRSVFTFITASHGGCTPP